MDVAVVGGGAVGATLAYDLTPEADVTLYEAAELAAGATGRAAGLCYDAFADRRDASLGERALARFRELSGDGGFTFESCPYVWLVRDEGDDRSERLAARVTADAARMRDHGRDVTVYEDASALGDRFPELVTADVAVAAVAESAGYADPTEYTTTMGLLARARGAEIREATPVTLTPAGAVATDAGVKTYDAVVVAAGAHTSRVVAPMRPLAVKPYRVQALVTDRADVDVPMTYDASNGFYLRPHEGGLLVGDGTEPIEQDPTEWDPEADTDFREACISYQERALGWSWPEANSWAGLCTATPDGDPLVGRLPDAAVGGTAAGGSSAARPDIYVATGWQGHGFMRAPAVAERLAKQILGEESGIDGFAPSRFDGDESFEIVEGMTLE